MTTPLSPWADSAARKSPDGRFEAAIDLAYEIRLGAPTSGTLLISESGGDERVLVRVESCNPSFVWSSDSQSLAVPQWTDDLDQHLCIVSMPAGTVRVLPQRFRVLELHSFMDGVVSGIDSPIYQPRKVGLRVLSIFEHA